MENFSTRLAPTRAFIREHLIPLNNIVLLAGSVVASLDFLAPRLSILPKIVYSATGGFACVLLLAAFTPGVLNRSVAAVMRATDAKSLRASPPWQISVVILALITLLGGVSIAKADAGGMIASSSSVAAGWQSSLLGLQATADEIKSSTDRANKKLDVITAKLGAPSFAGDNCPDIVCALGMGASKATLQKFLDRGVRLPTDPNTFGSSFNRLSQSRDPVRTDALALYLDTKAFPDVDARIAKVNLADRPSREAIAAQLPVANRAQLSEVLYAKGLGCPGPTLRLIELAAINGDKDLYSWLAARGANPRLTNTWCQSGPFAVPFTAEAVMAATRS